MALKAGGRHENLLSMLDGGHTTHRETAAVARVFYLIDDGVIDVSSAQEVRMQRVKHPVSGNGLLSRGGCLPENLSTKHAAGANVAALATEQVVFDALKAEQIDQFRNKWVHGETLQMRGGNYR